MRRRWRKKRERKNQKTGPAATDMNVQLMIQETEPELFATALNVNIIIGL